VSDIRQLIERVAARQQLEAQKRKLAESGLPASRPTHYVIGAGGLKIRPTQHLDGATLKEWLIKEKVAETLFGDGAHPEVLKRAAPVLRFLSQEGALTQEIVDLVWKCQQGKHEETVRVVYGLINEVVEDLPPALLDSLFQKISEVPRSEYSEMYLLFLKDYTLRALDALATARERADYARREQLAAENDSGSEPMQEIPARGASELKVLSNLEQAIAQPESVLSEGDKLYGLPVFWGILQDSYPGGDALSSAELLRVALDCSREILALPFARSARLLYLVASLKNLKEGTSLYPSVCVAIGILEGYGAANEDDTESLSTRRAIELVEGQLGLVSTILDDITHYDSQVKEALKQLVRKNKAAPENVESYVFAGRTEHQLTLEKLLELLEFVVLGSDQSVTIEA